MTKARPAIGRKATSLTQDLSSHSTFNHVSGSIKTLAKHTTRRQIGNESGELGTNLNVTSRLKIIYRIIVLADDCSSRFLRYTPGRYEAPHASIQPWWHARKNHARARAWSVTVWSGVRNDEKKNYKREGRLRPRERDRTRHASSSTCQSSDMSVSSKVAALG